MKKEYSKPMLYIEDFTLTQHIAACDAPDGALHYKGTCAYNDGDPDFGDTVGFFYKGIAGCDLDASDENNAINCYYGPIGAGAFAS